MKSFLIAVTLAFVCMAGVYSTAENCAKRKGIEATNHDQSGALVASTFSGLV